MTPKPARVLVVVDSLLLGGAERCAVDMAAALDRRRFEPHVVVTRLDGPLRRVLDEAGIPCTVLGRTRRIAPRAAARLRRAIRSSDLVHAHKFGSGVWSAMLAWHVPVPLVVHEHNWTGEPGRVHSILNARVIGRRADRVVCVSRSVHRQACADGIDEGQAQTIPNAVARGVALPRELARRRLGIDPAAWTLGIVAGLRPEKAHEVALEALADERLAERGVRLCVIGSGPRSHELRSHASALGVDDRVDWLGPLQDHVADDGSTISAGAAYAAAFDAALICSDWEGLPLFALESMAAATPVVATRVGELPHLLRDDVGVLVPTRDPDALVDGICVLHDHPQRAREMGAAAARRIDAEHSLESQVAQLHELYDELLAGRARGGRAA